MEYCPSCNKELRDISDYPLILIKLVKRIEIPENILITDFGSYIVPEEDLEEEQKWMIEYFRQNPQTKIHMTDSEILKRGEFEPIWRLPTPIEHLIRYFKPKNERYFYEIIENQTKKVIEGINSYLSTLESLVGKEVKMEQIFYPFYEENNSVTNFIPETSHYIHTENNHSEVTAYIDCEEGGGFLRSKKELEPLSRFEITKIQCEGRLKKDK
jgi:hypothetical protein